MVFFLHRKETKYSSTRQLSLFSKHATNLNGLGFFFPRKDEQDLYNLNNDDSVIDPKISFDAEFIICDPNEFLEYLSTQRCIGMRKLSPEYIFNN